MRWGAGSDERGYVIMLTLGTGIGSALFIDGRLFPNSELGHLEFLELMLEDEMGRRQGRSLQARINRAHFDEVKTLAEFDFTFNPKIPGAQSGSVEVRPVMVYDEAGNLVEEAAA